MLVKNGFFDSRSDISSVTDSVWTVGCYKINPTTSSGENNHFTKLSSLLAAIKRRLRLSCDFDFILSTGLKLLFNQSTNK